MPATLRNVAAVVVANDVNLSIFKPHWLVDHGILRREEFGDQVVVSPAIVQVSTGDFELTILPNRIQQTFRSGFDGVQDALDRVLGGIIKLLPHTPYTALGLNFEYSFAKEDERDFNAWTRACFASPFATSVVPPGASAVSS